MQSDELKRRISAGRGDTLADLVLKNARIVNVFTDEKRAYCITVKICDD